MNSSRQQICNFLMHEETPVDSILLPYSFEQVFLEMLSVSFGMLTFLIILSVKVSEDI